MSTSQQESQEDLGQESMDLDLLLHEHRILDEKVNALSVKSHLTPEEDLELHKLKKEKLRLKDRIETVRHDQESA